MHKIIKNYLKTGAFEPFSKAVEIASPQELAEMIRDVVDTPATSDNFAIAQSLICFKGYSVLVSLVLFLSNKNDNDFKENTKTITDFIDNIDYDIFKQIVKHIGTIPEAIEHDSTAEKLYSKASDIVLARCFREMGLRARALDERGDAADIVAESICGHGYSLVADAKCFRLSRTAKNQKDFKINNLAHWRGSDNDYAVLVSPFFQYPSKKSQIYSDSLDKEVCILGWEHIYTFLKFGLKETEQSPIETIFKITQAISRDKSLAYKNRSVCFLDKVNFLIAKKLSISVTELEKELCMFKTTIIVRGDQEINFWQNEINKYKSFTREQAIDELIKSKKLNEKIAVIRKYISNLQGIKI